MDLLDLDGVGRAGFFLFPRRRDRILSKVCVNVYGTQHPWHLEVPRKEKRNRKQNGEQ